MRNDFRTRILLFGPILPLAALVSFFLGVHVSENAMTPALPPGRETIIAEVVTNALVAWFGLAVVSVGAREVRENGGPTPELFRRLAVPMLGVAAATVLAWKLPEVPRDVLFGTDFLVGVGGPLFLFWLVGAMQVGLTASRDA